MKQSPSSLLSNNQRAGLQAARVAHGLGRIYCQYSSCRRDKSSEGSARLAQEFINELLTTISGLPNDTNVLVNPQDIITAAGRNLDLIEITACQLALAFRGHPGQVIDELVAEICGSINLPPDKLRQAVNRETMMVKTARSEDRHQQEINRERLLHTAQHPHLRRLDTSSLVVFSDPAD